ncbi:MAG TPA: right-handed parallel beta-helix repeat-containing protein [Rhizomicrobium sp.]|jgi:parallel beta-helix repeat protein|nr:right-handed parallel beta-helix repeat-containing protein [Rhizomicrobium sp.]
MKFPIQISAAVALVCSALLGVSSVEAAPAYTQHIAADGVAKSLHIGLDKTGRQGASDALNGIIASLSPKGVIALDLAPGTYLIDKPVALKSNVVLRGTGDVVFRRATTVAGPGFTMFGQQGEGLHDFGFDTIALDGNRQSDADQFSVILFNDPTNASSRFVFLDSTLRHFSRLGMGLHVKGVRDLEISNSTFADGGRGLFHSIYLLRCINARVVGNHISLIGGQGIKDSGQPGQDYGGLIANNDIRGVLRGINIADFHDIVVRDNTIKDASEAGIIVGHESNGQSWNVTLQNNSISNSTAGISLKASRVKIIGGRLTDNAIGLHLRAAKDITMQGVSLINTANPGTAFVAIDDKPKPSSLDIQNSTFENRAPGGRTLLIQGRENGAITMGQSNRQLGQLQN